MNIKQTAQENTLTITPHKPNLREKLFFLISGIIISVPFTIFVGQFASALCMTVFYTSICSTVLFTPFIEEFAKAYPLFYRHGETERSLYSLGFLTGLGFGISEFLLYVFLIIPATRPQLSVTEAILIRLPGLFFHAASTSITTFGIANKRIPRFYLIAVVLHAINNFSASIDLWFIGGPAAVVITYILAWRCYKATSERFIKSG